MSRCGAMAPLLRVLSAAVRRDVRNCGPRPWVCSQKLLLRQPFTAAHRYRGCASSTPPSAAPAEDQDKQRWAISENQLSLKGGLISAKVEVRYEAADLDRFPQEHAMFRNESRLMPSSLPKAPSEEEMDWLPAIKYGISLTRLGDLVQEPFIELVFDRICQGQLMESFGIPAIEDRDIAQPSHSKAVPGEGAYLKLRMQVYWLALHVWLLHSKQHLIQKNNNLFDSAVCALLTRRVFEWQWDRIRMLLYAADVPVMSITNELQDLQEFVFGLCQALDYVFEEEAVEVGGTAAALALDSADIPSGCHGLAPRIKYALWANVYSGSVPHESPELYGLTVYLLRQRLALEATARGSFFMCRFDWADMPQWLVEPTV